MAMRLLCVLLGALVCFQAVVPVNAVRVAGDAHDLPELPTPKDEEQVEVLGSAGEINPVSTAVKCVMNLTIQYLAIYTALAILRVVAEFQGENISSWTIGESLQQATITVNFAPMAAVLFL